VRTRILASVTLWLFAVTSIAAIAWLAIDAAGRQVTSSPIAASLPGHTSTPTRSTGTSSATGKPTPTGSTRVTRAVVKATTHPAASGRKPTPSPTPSRPKSRPGPPPPPPAVADTYTTSGGRVRVVCHGPMVTLNGGYAQPAPGWSVRVASGGPVQVQVVFEQADDQALLVLATCADGHPQFDQNRIEAGSPPQGPPQH
jgi:hypothetical protein